MFTSQLLLDFRGVKQSSEEVKLSGDEQTCLCTSGSGGSKKRENREGGNRRYGTKELL
jgi:hypothetical protein